MLFTKLTLCSQIRNIVLKVAMNLVFIYLGEECLVITYSASELEMWIPDVCFEPAEPPKIVSNFLLPLTHLIIRIKEKASGVVIAFICGTLFFWVITQPLQLEMKTKLKILNHKMLWDLAFKKWHKTQEFNVPSPPFKMQVNNRRFNVFCTAFW